MFNEILEEIGITDRLFGLARYEPSLRSTLKANMQVYNNYNDAFKISFLQLYNGIIGDGFSEFLRIAEKVYNEMKPNEASNDL